MNLPSRFLGATATLIFVLTLANCGGSSNSTPTTVPTQPISPANSPATPGNYVWELDSQNDLRTATIDSNGTVGPPVEAGNTVANSQAATATVATDPGHHFLFALDTTINQVRVFSILGPGVKLMEVTGSPFPPYSPGTLQTLLIGPKGDRLYILEAPSSIQTANIDAKTGALSFIESFEVEGPTFEEITMTPSGVFIVANDVTAGQIFGFNLSDNSFLEVPGGDPFTVPSGGQPNHLATDSSSKFVYATLAGGGVAGFAIDQTSGMLTDVPGSPFLTSDLPAAIAASPNAGFLYVANQSGKIDSFAIDPSTGDLMRLAGSPSVTASQPSSITVDATGNFLLIANEPNSDIYSFKIDSSGGLTAVSGSPFQSIAQPTLLQPLNIP